MLEHHTARLMLQHNIWLTKFKRYDNYLIEATDLNLNKNGIYLAYLTKSDALHWAIPFYMKPHKTLFNLVVQQEISKFVKYLSNHLILV